MARTAPRPTRTAPARPLTTPIPTFGHAASRTKEPHEALLRLGHRRYRHRRFVRGHGLDDVARGLPAADRAGAGLVAYRHFHRRAAELPRHGVRLVPVGRAVGPVRHARRRAHRRRTAW